jgi:polyhydroxyalkanoate synthase subunit PhaC
MAEKGNVGWDAMVEPLKTATDLILGKAAGEPARLVNRLMAARDVLLSPLETGIAPTPYEVVYESDRVKLKHYKPAEVKYKTPLFVCYAMVNRETMLDLQSDRSVVTTFLNHGLEVYMIDWSYPTRKDRYLTIDDHVNGYMDEMIDFVLEKHGIPQVHLMGICMGGTLCIMYTALHREKVKNLITTVTPVDFDTDKGLLNVWAKSLDADALIDAYGNIPGDILNVAYLLLNPARLLIDKYVGFLENVHDKDFVENFVRMEKWIFDSPDIPAETFREFIKKLYHENLLIKNKMTLGGELVNLKKITMPVLNIYAKLDHLVPYTSSEKFLEHVGSVDKTDVCLNTGHIGIYVSSKMQQEFAPRILSWLSERDAMKKNGKGRTRQKKLM